MPGEERPAVPGPLAKKMNVEFQGQRLDFVCAYLRRSYFNVRADKGVAGVKIHARLTRAPVASIVRQLAKAAGARAYLAKDGSVLITRKAMALPQVPCLDPRPRTRALSAEERKALPAHLKALGSDDWRDRKRATAALVKLGVAVLPALRPLLKSKDPEIVRRVEHIVDRLTKGDYRGRILSQLRAERKSCDFVKSSLRGGLDYIRAISEVNLVVSHRAESKMSTPIDLKLKKATIEDILYWLVTLARCEYVIEDHAFFIRPAPPLSRTLDEKTKKLLDQKASVDFEKKPVRECFDYIRTCARHNFVVDPDCKRGMKKLVSLKLTDRPLYEILAKLLDTADLQAEYLRGAIYVRPARVKPRGDTPKKSALPATPRSR